MQAAAHKHQYVKAGAALAAASVVAVAPVMPVTPLPSPMSAVERAMHLVADEDSILNVPFNLFQDIVNIPANQIAAIDEGAKSLLYGGSWWVPSATNIWGTDPGDYGHYAAILSLLFPFREISGLGQPEIDPAALENGTAGLAQQFNMVAAAELPTSASSDADWSSPLAPTPPITGLAALDKVIWSAAAFSGQQEFPLINNWFQVPFSDLVNGYTFNFDPTHNVGALANPSMGVGENGSVPGDFGYEGTKPLFDANGDPVLNDAGNPINLMPWAGETFKLNLFGPFQQYFQSLMAPPDSSDFSFGLPADDPDTGLAAPLDGFVLPDFQDVIYAFQTLLASLVVAFDPFTAGSPVCFGACTEGFPGIVSMVQAIGALYPGNPLIDHWLDLASTPNPNVDPDNPNLDMTDAQTGLVNWATPHQIFSSIEYLQGSQGFFFDFGNPGPDDPPIDGPYGVDTPISFPISPAIQNLIQFMQDSGIQDLVQQLADAAGYTPIDYGTDAGDAAGDAGSTAADSTDLSSLASELTNPADWGSLF